jgi:death on curing protein
VTPTWINKDIALAIHDEQLAEHGGLAGVRDIAGLEAALARPLNLTVYGQPDIFDLAACYACGLGQRQYFIDGNKRVSAVVTELFLEINGFILTASDLEVVDTWRRLANNKLSEKEVAEWLREHSRQS